MVNVTYEQVYQQARQLSVAQKARLIAVLAIELVAAEDLGDEPVAGLAELWQQLDADPAGWRGERTASEELLASRR